MELAFISFLVHASLAASSAMCPLNPALRVGDTIGIKNFATKDIPGNCYGLSLLENQLLNRATFSAAGRDETEGDVEGKLEKLYSDPNAQPQFNATDIRELSEKFPKAFKQVAAEMQQRYESTDKYEVYDKAQAGDAMKLLASGKAGPYPMLGIDDDVKNGEGHVVIGGTVIPGQSGAAKIYVEDSNYPGDTKVMNCSADGMCVYDGAGWGSGVFRLSIMQDPTLNAPPTNCSGSSSTGNSSSGSHLGGPPGTN